LLEGSDGRASQRRHRARAIRCGVGRPQHGALERAEGPAELLAGVQVRRRPGQRQALRRELALVARRAGAGDVVRPQRRRPGGGGLGLSIVARIVEAHGGSIAVEDRAGGGAVFILSLPPSAAEDVAG